jgi:hypothetical protein
VDVRRLAGPVTTGQGCVEVGALAGAETGQGLVEALDHRGRADLVGDALDRVDLLAVDVRGQVDGDEVAGAGRAVHADQRAEPLTQGGDPLLDVLVTDLDVVDGDRERLVVRQLHRRAHVDLRGELQLATLATVRDVGDVDRRLAERAHLVLLDGLAVEAREGVVDGLLEDRAATDPLVDDPGRDVTPAKARDVHLAGDRPVRRVQARLELLVRHLDGQLHPGRVEGLDGRLHER